MLYQFGIVFFIIFLLPVTTDILLGFHKAAIMHSIDALLLCTLPFAIKHFKKLDAAVNYFFVIVSITILLAAMMLNPERLDTIFVVWIMFFMAMSALLQRGLARILYCFCFGWLPILYVILNIKLKGAITWNWIVQSGTEQPPVFLIFIPVVLCIYAIWNHTKTIREAQHTITHQKQIIEEKNTAITDSITYAKRIQEAKLPKKEDIYTSLPKSFILFKPKDIVSGDFYFFYKKGHTVFIAAADCTGHGVPGAIMSMIGSEKLEDAVSQSADVSEILSLLNKGIKSALKQSDSDQSTRDGMDIALCSVDTKNRIVKYAGANRPIWIIRDRKAEIEEIKATKKAIGGLTNDSEVFNSHEIKFAQGDTFYIFTDGYADTFGGQNNKKLTTNKFRQILIGVQDQTMQEQETFLGNFIEDWKANTEQVDDILVIGIQL